MSELERVVAESISPEKCSRAWISVSNSLATLHPPHLISRASEPGQGELPLDLTLWEHCADLHTIDHPTVQNALEHRRFLIVRSNWKEYYAWVKVALDVDGR